MSTSANVDSTAMAIVSKMYCSRSQAVMVVRRRPHVVSGGGFVVTDIQQRVVFRADGCGTLGTGGRLILRDGEGNPLLLIRRQVHDQIHVHTWPSYLTGMQEM